MNAWRTHYDRTSDEWETFRAGAYYKNGAVRIPTFWHPQHTPATAKIWARNGFDLDRTWKEWTRDLSEDKAEETIRWANATNARIWKMPFGEEGLKNAQETNERAAQKHNDELKARRDAVEAKKQAERDEWATIMAKAREYQVEAKGAKCN